MFSGKVEKEDEDRLWMKGGGEEEESGAEGGWNEGRGFNSCVYRVSGTNEQRKREFFSFHFPIERFSIVESNLIDRIDWNRYRKVKYNNLTFDPFNFRSKIETVEFYPTNYFKFDFHQYEVFLG